MSFKGFFGGLGIGLAEALTPNFVFGDSIDKISIVESSSKVFKYIDYYLLRISKEQLPYKEEELIKHYKRI